MHVTSKKYTYTINISFLLLFLVRFGGNGFYSINSLVTFLTSIFIPEKHDKTFLCAEKRDVD